ncbi:hypothetical protein RRG08_053559 [Elysia crispata]|uniref:Uncharacterized protein n=1 Tax=Elysia crispata TaxID=231223 RepID=A0AAE0Y2P6_9GAST|nr:hypothetical protein RRG08_053559 [Elysia crispata]
MCCSNPFTLLAELTPVAEATCISQFCYTEKRGPRVSHPSLLADSLAVRIGTTHTDTRVTCYDPATGKFWITMEFLKSQAHKTVPLARIAPPPFLLSTARRPADGSLTTAGTDRPVPPHKYNNRKLVVVVIYESHKSF